MTVTDPLPPAFFPVGLNLVGRRCVIIGDDHEAMEKEAALREVGADVVRIREAAAVRDDDVIDAFFVIATPKDEALCRRLRRLAERHRFLFCAIDQPAHGFVAMQAIVKSGPTRIGISTGGVAPRVGKTLKEALQGALDATFVRFMDCLATQRRRNRSLLEGIPERRDAMLRSADGFAVEVRVRYPAWFEDELASMRPAAAPPTAHAARGG